MPVLDRLVKLRNSSSFQVRSGLMLNEVRNHPGCSCCSTEKTYRCFT